MTQVAALVISSPQSYIINLSPIDYSDKLARGTEAAVDHWLPFTCTAESAALTGRIYGR